MTVRAQALVEIALVMQAGDAELRAELSRVADATPAGAGCYWSLPT